MHFTIQQKMKVCHLASVLLHLCDPQFSLEFNLQTNTVLTT